MTHYRVTFDDKRVYEIEGRRDRLLGVGAPVVSALVFRVVRGKRLANALTRPEGPPLEFHAATPLAAVALICDVLQTIHGTKLVSLVET